VYVVSILVSPLVNGAGERNPLGNHSGMWVLMLRDEGTQIKGRLYHSIDH
jgi:hypothetical protein